MEIWRASRRAEPGCTPRSRCCTHLWAHGFVDGAPPDILLRPFFFDDSLVRGRATGLCSRVRGQGAAGGDGRAGLVHQSIFVEGGDRRVGNLDALLNIVDESHGLKCEEWVAYDGHAIIVYVCSLVKFLLKLCVLVRWPVRLVVSGACECRQASKQSTHWTPPGCRAVRFTFWDTIPTLVTE